jgi:hypothetical protein
MHRIEVCVGQEPADVGRQRKRKRSSRKPSSNSREGVAQPGEGHPREVDQENLLGKREILRLSREAARREQRVGVLIAAAGPGLAGLDEVFIDVMDDTMSVTDHRQPTGHAVELRLQKQADRQLERRVNVNSPSTST